MNWQSIHQELPQETGNYLASITWPHHGGQYVFTDLVHYRQKDQRWFKYDPYDPNYAPVDDITDFVLGWVTDSIAYLGQIG